MRIATVFLSVACLNVASASCAADPLPAWSDTATKQAIVAFVGKVTKEGSPDFVLIEGGKKVS
jgi:hypothetical protein